MESLQKAYDDLVKDTNQLQAIGTRLITNAESAKAAPELKTIFAQIDKVKQAHKEAQERYYNAIDDVLAKSVETTRGLCSYAEGTGQASAGTRYLREECRSFDNAKNNHELRRTLVSQICRVSSSVVDAVEGSKASTPDGSILAEYESITDPEYSSAFYKRNEAEIQRQYQARLNGNQLN